MPHQNRPERAELPDSDIVTQNLPFWTRVRASPSNRHTNVQLVVEARLSPQDTQHIPSVVGDAWTGSTSRFAGRGRHTQPGGFIAPLEPPLKLTFGPCQDVILIPPECGRHPALGIAVVSAGIEHVQGGTNGGMASIITRAPQNHLSAPTWALPQSQHLGPRQTSV